MTYAIIETATKRWVNKSIFKRASVFVWNGSRHFVPVRLYFLPLFWMVPLDVSDGRTQVLNDSRACLFNGLRGFVEAVGRNASKFTQNGSVKILQMRSRGIAPFNGSIGVHGQQPPEQSSNQKEHSSDVSFWHSILGGIVGLSIGAALIVFVLTPAAVRIIEAKERKAGLREVEELRRRLLAERLSYAIPARHRR